VRRALWILGLGCVLWAHAYARAQDAARLPLELSWQAPPECGTSDDVRAELERAAHALPGYALAPLRAQAQVDRQERGYALRLVTEHEGEHGERQLEARDCPTLVRSMTLVLALAFGKGVELAQPAGGTAAGSASQTQPTPAQQRHAAAARIKLPKEQKKSDEHRRSAQQNNGRDSRRYDADMQPLQLWLMLGGGAQLTLFPSVAGVFVGGVELTTPSWAIALRYNAWWNGKTKVGPGLATHFEGNGALLQGCWRNSWAPARAYALCGLANAAALEGRAQGSFEDGSATAPWLGFGASASLTLAILRIEAGLAVSATQPRFVITGFGPVHEVPLFVAQLSASLRIPLPQL
jgi:hypothetical protein